MTELSWISTNIQITDLLIVAAETWLNPSLLYSIPGRCRLCNNVSDIFPRTTDGKVLYWCVERSEATGSFLVCFNTMTWWVVHLLVDVLGCFEIALVHISPFPWRAHAHTSGGASCACAAVERGVALRMRHPCTVPPPASQSEAAILQKGAFEGGSFNLCGLPIAVLKL